jgi:hypothetical protein
MREHSCKSMRSLVGLLCLGALAQPTTPVHSQTSCPTTTLNCDGVRSVRSEPEGRISCQESGSSSAGYDLVLGTVNASARHFDPWELPYTSAGVVAEDIFTIVGIQAGEVLTFQARLSVRAGACSGGPACCNGSAEVGLRESESNSARVRTPNPEPYECPQVSAVAQIALTRLAGEPFSLTFFASAYGGEGGSGAAEGTLSFAGLPPGAIVRSCHGFAQDFPVPALPLTWGSLKQRYR